MSEGATGCETGAPQRALFGRRKGKPLRPTQAGLFATLLPRLAIDASRSIADARRLFPEAVRGVRLEIGLGGGEHFVSEAARRPDVGFIGCEPFVNGLAKTLAAIDRLRLANIRLFQGDGLALTRRLPDACLERIYLLYPDPWPKRRHRKRRFVNAASLEDLARALHPGGELRFATDIDDYAAWTLAHIARSSHFDWSARRASDWSAPWPDWPGTRYEAKALAAARSPVYLTFARR